MEDTQQNQPVNEQPAQSVEQAPVEQKPAEPKPNVPGDEKLLGALCYVPFLCALTCPLAVIKKPQSKFTEFHAGQGFVLFITWFLSLFVVGIIGSLFLGSLIWLLLLAACAVGLVMAFSGEMFQIPGLSAVAAHVPVKKFFGTVKKQAGVPQETSTEEAPVEEPVVEAPVVEQPVVEEPVAETPVVEPVVEAPVVEQPVQEEQPTPVESVAPEVVPAEPTEPVVPVEEKKEEVPPATPVATPEPQPAPEENPPQPQ